VASVNGLCGLFEFKLSGEVSLAMGSMSRAASLAPEVLDLAIDREAEDRQSDHCVGRRPDEDQRVHVRLNTG